MSHAPALTAAVTQADTPPAQAGAHSVHQPGDFRRVAPGVQIGGFEVLDKLHKGGMANLWRVRRAGTPEGGETWVMKVPFLGDHDDPTALVGFEQESMILPRLSGPHVPRFVAAGDFDEHPYLVMEQIPGESLRPLLDQLPLTLDVVVDRIVRVALAVHALHQQGVIHLDLKPSNIMFRRVPDGSLGEAVLVDFGLAHHQRLPDLLAEEFRLPMGTGPYMAPEQVLRERREPRSDLFALGVMLYFMVTGERPFGQPTSVSGLKRRLWFSPPPPRALRPDCPAWLQEVTLRCLEVEPAARYPSAAALAFDLQHPEQVTLSARSHASAGGRGWQGMRYRLSRWFRALGFEPRQVQAHASAPVVSSQLAHATFIVVAVDLSQQWRDLSEQLRLAAERLLRVEPGARLACLTVLKTHYIANDDIVDEHGRNRHALQLAQLQHWARPLLQTGASRITHHVLESPDAATAVLEFARRNQADHLMLGSRGSSALRRHLGSVSSRVVAEAPCSVTVVRVPGG
jgi:nucleotide-binding universal stress UspA family protein